VAPIRPVKQMKQAAMEYPIHTQSHDCHQERPLAIMEDEIIQVFWHKISRRRRRLPSTGFTHDIERVCHPKADKIPRTPLPSCWLNWLQIVICQHQLSIGQARLGLDSQFPRPYFGLLSGSHADQAES
jgi:hypothetical protein